MRFVWTLLASLAVLSLPIASAQIDRPAEAAPLAARSLLLDITRSGSRFIAVGDRGHVLRSDDSGRTWKQASSVPTQSLLTAVHFVDERLGWAVGHDEVILATTDGGDTWTKVQFAPEAEQPLLDVWFADAMRGIAVGAYGAYFTTTDGGKSWVASKFAAQPVATESEFSEDLPPDYHLNRIVSAGKRLYIAAEAGQLYRSDDAGATWSALPSPYEGSFYGVLPLDGDSLLAFGLRGHAFRSDDAGATWRELDTGTVAMLTDGVRLADGTIVLSGLSGTLLVSRDGGASFDLLQQSDRKGLAALVPGSAGDVVVVGEAGARAIALRGSAQ